LLWILYNNCSVFQLLGGTTLLYLVSVLELINCAASKQYFSQSIRVLKLFTKSRGEEKLGKQFAGNETSRFTFRCRTFPVGRPTLHADVTNTEKKFFSRRIFSSGVNFINIFCVRFSYEFRRLVTFQLGAKNSYENRAQKH